MEDSTRSIILPDNQLLHLKERREALNQSIQDVSNRLRINEKYIHALEENNLPKQLPFIFLRGYLRSYARYLNISEQQIKLAIEAFDQYRQENKIAPTLLIPKMTNVQPTRFSWAFSVSTFAVIFSLVTLSATTLYYKPVPTLHLTELSKNLNLDYVKNYIKTHWQV